MKQLLILLLLGGVLLSCSPRVKQNKMNAVHIEFEGRRYDSLNLILVLNDRRSESISGISEDGYHWLFLYPDSLYDYISSFSLLIPGILDSVVYSIAFRFVLQGDTVRANGGFFFERPSSLIRARYIETLIHHDVLVIRQGTTDDVIYGTVIVEDFEIFTEDQQLIPAMKSRYFGYGFYRWQLTYEEMIERDLNFIKQYPNSRWMISLLSSNMGIYRSKDDIAKLFNLFSEELQQSFFGQIIYRHITRDMTFINQKLATWDTGLLEKIVQDSSMFNLILFSASWCAPCIRQIPILKEIYRNSGQKLIMTYVSLDHERTAENWRKKMRTHEIPWRSLMVLSQEKDRIIRNDYAVFGVPTAIIVHPYSMKKEVLNLWEEEHRQRLYELVTNQ